MHQVWNSYVRIVMDIVMKKFPKERKGYAQTTPDEAVLSPWFKLDQFCLDCQLRPVSCGLVDNVRQEVVKCLRGILSTFGQGASEGPSYTAAPHTAPILKEIDSQLSQLPMPGLTSQEFTLLCSIADTSHLTPPYMVLCFYFRPSFNCITLCSFLWCRFGNLP